ncbi:precorrin-3B synthase [Saccharopolyspora sp. HNM0983]|uniref:Precorrin-3B synthase n=1 Tax=Saccharopolyspora montiporae TaxID=2781240 RepID=A0A929B947_9PSEU|nr:nitrite/sulfite reductase [Saccharopolyspora sp. HNM0983]MBE9373332.1 precorrin-3B synthase [Saccharopolyspora sp. HNM0983]
MSSSADRARRRGDACPGVLRPHPAADGGLVRIRVPGGLLDARQFQVLSQVAVEFGAGFLDLTSRGNVQLRGLDEDALPELAVRLSDVGLLPSGEHEKVRNIIASPLSGCDAGSVLDVADQVRAVDRALCADPGLAGLSGRFLFVLDDGRGDVAGLGGDVTALPVSADSVALLLGGVDSGLRVPVASAVEALLGAARAFQVVQADAGSAAWRIAELPGAVSEITRLLRAAVPAELGEPVPVPPPRQRGPIGVLPDGRGCATLSAAAPFGRLTGEQLAAVAGAMSGSVRLTPWRGVVLPQVADPDAAQSWLDGAGMVVDAASPWNGVTACAGRPGCAKSLTDVRGDARRALPLLPAGAAVHFSGCARRCGRPRGEVVDVVAGEHGYEVSRGTGNEDARTVADGTGTTAAIAALRREE